MSLAILPACKVQLVRPSQRGAGCTNALLYTRKVGSNVSKCHRSVFAIQAGKDKGAVPDDDDDDDIVLAEVELKARRNRKRRKLPQAGAGGKLTPLEPEAVAGSQTETIVLQSLALGFFIILLQGVTLAASGFLPEAADIFIVDYIYPSFSYQLGFFFTCSTAYGLWKTSATSAK